MNHTFCVFIRITLYFPEEKHGNINEKIQDPLVFCADQIDIITNFAVITNVFIKRVHCI